jgi:esterase/lipase superfamily enzyme
LAISGLFAVVSGCRAPVAPVVADKSLGIVYDTAMEDQIRSGTAPSLVASAFESYVDTLDEPVSVTRWNDSECDWLVFAATNRGRFLADGPDDSRVLSESSYGKCVVTIPHRRRGQEVRAAKTADRESDAADSGDGLSFASAPASSGSAVSRASSVAASDAARSVTRARVTSERQTAAEFHAGVSELIDRSRLRDVMVFVHGFNVSFDDAVARAAQLGLDMPFNGAVVAYCWPSQGGIDSYEEDEAINYESIEPFMDFIQTLRLSIPSDARIHIVVHSMGNRMVLQGLRKIALNDPKRFGVNSSRPVHNLVLCAPDVGLGDFKAWVPDVVPLCERVTLYANSSDTALIASKSLHAEPRAGDARFLPIIDGVQTIDCSRIDMSFMGHSYYGSNPDVLTDLFTILRENAEASQRPHLKRRWSRHGTYWEFARSAGTILCTWHFEDPGEHHEEPPAP